MSSLDRRSFLRRAAVYGGGAVLAPSLTGLAACADQARVAGLTVRRVGPGDGGYGALLASPDAPELALPRGFRTAKLSQAGDVMSDGHPTPNAFDGMAAFPLPNGNIRLIRNHEIRDSAATARPFGNATMAYDQKAGGGNTSLEVCVRPDGTRELVRHYASLTGTHVNCAGGPTPWGGGSWITCEETTEGVAQGRGAEHGYVFEIPVSAEDEVLPVPFKAMGRFVHEALAVDALTGIVYLTEDISFRAGDPSRPGAGFYRYVPTVPGNLVAGGRLQMLALKDRPRYDSTTGQRPGRPLPVTWVDIDDPDPANAAADPSAVFRQGLAQGGTIFQRLEGCWYGDGSVFFNATSGGDAGRGQVWQYRPRARSGGQLILVFESPGEAVLDSPDNIVVSPRGGLVLCEDGGGVQFLRGLTRRGEIFDFGQNLANEDEFAGACFSPDGETLFVNIQGSTSSTGASKGMTFAIWGPWEDGAL
ncbi:MAG: alkaline phosphatase PhoX [Gemmatimonadales bacterium]